MVLKTHLSLLSMLKTVVLFSNFVETIQYSLINRKVQENIYPPPKKKNLLKHYKFLNCHFWSV